MPSRRRRRLGCRGVEHEPGLRRGLSVAIGKGTPWGRPVDGPVELVVAGDDADLAHALRARPHPFDDAIRVAWSPARGADFARAVGLTEDGGELGSLELPCDLMRVVVGERADDDLLAVNMVVVGVAPDQQRRLTRRHAVRVDVDGRTVHDGPACGVVVANGQHHGGADVVPRGHPGDGRIETQIYDVPRNERAGMRARLATGTHVPHPGIRQVPGTVVELTVTGRPAPIEIDRLRRGRTNHVRITVVAGALVLVV